MQTENNLLGKDTENQFRAGEMAWLAEYLPHKHEDLSLNPKRPGKRPGAVVTPALGCGEQEDLWGLLVS